ncbi:MAG TPA: hypothetical protein DIC22_08990 [Chitinophagaceae bacterium]|jgi:hypothetical protein|nr:hypothetical protein [Chitinophagaceae bacterium]
MSKTIACFISILLFCYSCKKETGVPGPAGPAGNTGLDGSLLDTGTISGNLAVYDEFSWPLADSSGVAVSLDLNGTPVSTTSDHSGNYYFHGLPSGTYNLTYQKPNFGTMKVFGISHSPGSNLHTIVPEVYLLQNPVKTAVDSIRMTDSYYYVFLTIYLDTSSLSYVQFQHNFMLLIGTDPNPSTANTTGSILSNYITPDGSGAYSLVIDKSYLGGINQSSGPYYISVGTYNRYIRAFKNQYSLFDTGMGGYYVDPSDGKFVFPNLKLSKVITVP